MSLPLTDAAAALEGPMAALKSLPILFLPASTLFTAEGDMTSRTKSVDVPPTCSPALAPPMVYIAGADHSSPLKFLPVRQVIAPRPPLPPTPTANFFTLGRTMMQLAVTSRLDGTALLSSIACNTVAEFLPVSSSLALSALQAGTVEIKSSETSDRHTNVLTGEVGITRLFHLAKITSEAKLYISLRRFILVSTLYLQTFHLSQGRFVGGTKRSFGECFSSRMLKSVLTFPALVLLDW